MAELRIRGQSSISSSNGLCGGGSTMEETLKNLLLAVLFAGSFSIFGAANAADGCGPGCH
ncbi:MAG TPA: hypothetical protein VIH87_13285 [Methylocella sp.]